MPDTSALPEGWQIVVRWLSVEFDRITRDNSKNDVDIDRAFEHIAQCEQVLRYHQDLMPELDKFRITLETATKAWAELDTETRLRVAATIQNTEEHRRRLEEHVANERMENAGGVEELTELKKEIRERQNSFEASQRADTKALHDSWDKYRSQKLAEAAQVKSTAISMRGQIVIAIITGIFMLLAILAPIITPILVRVPTPTP